MLSFAMGTLAFTVGTCAHCRVIPVWTQYPGLLVAEWMPCGHALGRILLGIGNGEPKPCPMDEPSKTFFNSAEFPSVLLSFLSQPASHPPCW